MLTKREREIFAYLAQGWTTKQIANELFISEKTVRNHISNVMQKVGASTRYEALAIVQHNGW